VDIKRLYKAVRQPCPFGRVLHTCGDGLKAWFIGLLGTVGAVPFQNLFMEHLLITDFLLVHDRERPREALHLEG